MIFITSRYAMEDKIKQTMAAVFSIDVSEISDNASPEIIENWDSLRHMNLLVALEEEFKIEFTDNEIVAVINFLSLKTIINDKISQAS